MLELDVETEMKVIIVGNGQVGKTSLMTRFVKGVFTGNYKKTIGADFMEKDIELEELGEDVRLLLWDTAGQEMFNALTRNYYKGATGVVYVFSTVDRDSFEAIEEWKNKVEDECGPIASVLVQNKIDLIDETVVQPEEAEKLASKMGVRLYRACVKDNILVDDIFHYLAEKFIHSGGQELGIRAVEDIQDHSEEQPKQKDVVIQNQGDEDKNDLSNEVVDINEPTTRRTDGKKRLLDLCTLL